MSIQFTCSKCNRLFEVSLEKAGSKAKCECGETIYIPMKQPEPPPITPRTRASDATVDRGVDVNAFSAQQTLNPRVKSYQKRSGNRAFSFLLTSAILMFMLCCVGGLFMVLQEKGQLGSLTTKPVPNAGIQAQLHEVNRTLLDTRLELSKAEDRELNLKKEIADLRREIKAIRDIEDRQISQANAVQGEPETDLRRPNIKRIGRNGEKLALGKNEADRVADIIETLKSHPVPDARAIAARKLAALDVNDKRISSALFNSFRFDSSPAVVLATAEALGRVSVVGESQKKILAKLYDTVTNAKSRDLRVVAADSIAAIDGSGTVFRKMINELLSPTTAKEVQAYATRLAWALVNLQNAHRRGDETEWAHARLIHIAESMADDVITGSHGFVATSNSNQFLAGRTYDARSERLHFDLLKTLELIAADDDRFHAHLKRYEGRELPGVSRTNVSADSLLTQYRLLMNRIEFDPEN